MHIGSLLPSSAIIPLKVTLFTRQIIHVSIGDRTPQIKKKNRKGLDKGRRGQTYTWVTVRTWIGIARAPGMLDVVVLMSVFPALLQNPGSGDKGILRSSWAS